MSERLAGEADTRSGPLQAISFRTLLSFYLIVPAVLIAVLLDVLVFGRTLHARLPDSPESWRWFGFLFVWPHIFASQFSLFDQEYLQRYRRMLGIGLPVVCCAAVGVVWLDRTLTRGLVYLSLTLYHTLFQQIGVASLMLTSVPRSFTMWKWSTLGIIVAASIGRGLESIWVAAGISGLLLPLTVLVYRCARYSQTRVGAWYVWSNHGLFVLMVIFALSGYHFFTVLMLRVVHDLTGFAFYIAHDLNRNRREIKNSFYRLLSYSRLPIFLQCPLAAVGLNALAQLGSVGNQVPLVLPTLGLIHYYTESLIWRRHTVHRESIVLRG